ncbi:MAG: hypothetical protein GY861_03010 [bacterium]|nr:hypothetical protein [bacterium]
MRGDNLLIFNKDETYFGEGFVSYGDNMRDNWLNVLDENGETEYQIPAWDCTHIINLSNPCQPSSYYRLNQIHN